MAQRGEGAAGHGPTTYKEATGCGQAPCKGRPPVGAAAHKGWHPRARSAAASPVASKGDDVRCKGGRPLAGQLPAAKGNRRLCWGSDDGGTVRVKEG
ncbi:hypothetical protein BHE74_00004714 [Ensete ventricosum]|nr:hypothetical protein BHE74_00004714 [Ensete ventricosum]RZR76077.1 hypothetical protein BHM03_00000682 [Ensete ventricosum]